ncbi:hypothetical protein Plec18167_003656 [Paecilomyces lecythidis]|uniref:USP domain-containing protein n=1 Tax=Paecilomyces lecythidis TaxID=3004212 RepID=A0ABR3XW68_9EURO
MEDTDPQTTRKRPRLDSGSGARESMSTPGSPSDPVSDQAAASPTPDQEVLAQTRPASRVTINMKSPATVKSDSATMESHPEQSDTSPLPHPGQSAEINPQSSTAISISSSPTQSPEIEVADVEDMDQDPATTNWRSLGDALRGQAATEVVQLREQLSLPDSFPKLRGNPDLRESIEEMGALIEKGHPHDTAIFVAVKNWLIDDCLGNMAVITPDTFLDEREFWEELPSIVEGLLRRGLDFQPNDGNGTWRCLEDFLLAFTRLALHLLHLDTLTLQTYLEETDVPAPELTSRVYLPSLGWILQTGSIPFYRTMDRLYNPELGNLVAHLNDQIAAHPFNAMQRLSEFTLRLMEALPRCPHLAPFLVAVVTITYSMVESGNERRKLRADDSFLESSSLVQTRREAYTLIRAIDDQYQEHISKKSPWLTSDTSESVLRYISLTYYSLSSQVPDMALQIPQDLSINFPENATASDYPQIIHWAWKFALLKKHVMEGRMELRVHGMEAMQNDLVNLWRQHIQNNPAGIEYAITQYMVRFLRENKIVEYIVGVGSHPQLISRSGNIIGFLVVTSTYTDQDTDTIWHAVTESQDPRIVGEILSMLTRTFAMHQASSNALLYLCSKLLELPLERFDARMIDFCEQLLHNVREKHSERSRLEPLDMMHVDAIPLRLCVRLIRETTALEGFSDEHKAFLQKFASTQLSLFLSIGLSSSDKMDMYERCIQDIAEMNQYTVGSIQALNALLPAYDPQEIRKLALDFDLTFLMISELAHALDSVQSDFSDSFSKNGLFSRIQLLHRLIDKVPDTLTPDLSDTLWHKILMSRKVVDQGRKALWDMLCKVTARCGKRNPFIERCIHEYIPALSPEDYSQEVLAFAEHAIGYEIRFNPPPIAGEGDIISIPGMDRIWHFILTAPPDTIEAKATTYAIEVYLDHVLIRRAPRSAAEATHISLVDRCVEQLTSAASKLKSFSDGSASGEDEPMVIVAAEGEIRQEELRFSRSLLFLRQFLQGLRTRPQYSPPQISAPELPERTGKGEIIEITYQCFDGGVPSKIRILRIGDLSTASDLVDRFVRITGFTKFDTIYGGQKIDLLSAPHRTLRELKLRSGLLIVRRVGEAQDASLPGRRQSLTPVDSEVLKHFDDLYDLLGLEDKLAREIFDFLVVFPPQKRVRDLVRSEENSAEEIFPMDKPYKLLYSVNALTTCLREESTEEEPNQAFLRHSMKCLVAALTRPELSDSIQESPLKLLFTCNFVESLLIALSVRSVPGDSPVRLSEPASLITQLLRLINTVQSIAASVLSEAAVQKLICNSFAVLIEGSIRDNAFWDIVKQNAQFEKLILALLLEESRQPIRKEIADNISMICGPTKSRKNSKSVETEMENRDLSQDSTMVDILATLWAAFVQNFDRTPQYVRRSQEFFEVALSVFRSVAEKSPRDLIFGEYLSRWSAIMLSHKTEEFVGRETVDHVVLGFARLIRLCLELAEITETIVNPSDIMENVFNNYLFPDLSAPNQGPIVPQVPVMHSQTRQELYNILVLLSKNDENYPKIIELLEDLIPQDYTYAPNWCFERQKTIRSAEGYAGLKNLSNTCYLNSLFTQLFMNVGFRDFMLQLQVEEPEGSQRLLEETKKMFANMQETWLKSVDTQGAVDSIRTYDNEPIDITIQMDVDEFYNLLFDRWEAQIIDAEQKKKFRSFYGGQLVQQIKSKECPHISERLEPFSAIQCEIKGKASLEDSLKAYVEGEIMQGDNKYSCTSCGRHVDAVKRACLKDLPDNLIFHLKRFDFDMLTMMRSKINDEFQFPERIDMTPFKVEHLSDPNASVPQDVFELVGVLVHSGTAESGHYYSYIRERPTSNSSGSWVEFNDADVSRFDPSKIADQCFGGLNDSLHGPAVGQVRFNKVWNAYMLFYQRVSSMDAEKSIYKPERSDIPVRASIPVALRNHITMENELFIRSYCLLDPYHAFFVRYLLGRSRAIVKSGKPETSGLEKSAIFIALDTLEQLVSRTRELIELDTIVSELAKAISETPKGAYRLIQWTAERPTGIRNLVLKSPHPDVRSKTSRIVASALARLQDMQEDVSLGDVEREKWQVRFSNSFENVVATLESLWPILHTASRSWDDYFDFLLLLANFGPYQAGVILDHGFLLKCLEIIWLDRDNTKLKRQYLAYYKLVERGRKFSHRKLMDLFFVLMQHIDLTLPATPDDERRTFRSGRYSLTATESSMIRPLGRNNELLLLKRILQQHSNPPACRNLVALFLESEPDAGLLEPICKLLEDGLRVAPAALCAPFLEATLVFCRRSPDEDRVVALVDYVAKGVESINNSGGREHLAFFTNLISIRNDKIGSDEVWFGVLVTERIPDWAPTLLMYADKGVRNMTFEVLRHMLFMKAQEEISDESRMFYTKVGKELAQASVEKLRKTYLVNSSQSVEARVVEIIIWVISHCLETYFDDSEEDAEFVHQATAVTTAIEELSVDLPDPTSESDLPSPEDWEDNSMVASDSEVGLAGSP